MGLVVAGNLSGPFLESLVPVDTFVFWGELKGELERRTVHLLHEPN